MKYLEQWLRARGIAGPLAYFHANWRRDAAPLLDELGACVDHVEAHSKGGSSQIENLATICARCNARKGALSADDHLKRYPRKQVKSKHGEPAHWDGLSTLFVALASESAGALSTTDRHWISVAISIAAPVALVLLLLDRQERRIRDRAKLKHARLPVTNEQA